MSKFLVRVGKDASEMSKSLGEYVGKLSAHLFAPATPMFSPKFHGIPRDRIGIRGKSTLCAEHGMAG